MNTMTNIGDLVLTEVPARTPDETLEERWFAETSTRPSLLPHRRSSVPPIGDDEVDPWLR